MNEYKKALESHMQSTLFRPQTGRPPKERPTNASDIYNHLIKCGNELEEKHEKQRTDEFERFRDNNPDVDTKSVKMLEQKKVTILEQIFDSLDGHDSGVISIDNLNLDNLSKNMLELFDPIFEEIQLSEIKLNKEQFVKTSLKMYEKLTPTEKQVLLEDHRTFER